MRKAIVLLAWVLIGCGEAEVPSNTKPHPNAELPAEVQSDQVANEPAFTLTTEQANQLAELPLACVGQEYPNKLGQVLGGREDLQSPKQLHPAFYGCFDWHSSVHGHWSLVRLLRTYPDLARAEDARNALNRSLTPANIEAEVAYFQGEHNTSFERTYGWGWLLKLAVELHTWDDPDARRWEAALQPLTDLIVQRYREFLPKLVYPIRVGEHTNTAFGMRFACDYARGVSDLDFFAELSTAGSRFFESDSTAAPIHWEPSGYDFLSPALEEVDLMRSILPKNTFLLWQQDFLPGLEHPDFSLEPGIVSDRTDGKLVHLDGLNFSRAWVLYGLAEQYPKEYGHLTAVANRHISHSLPHLVGDTYEGGHWLGSFAIFALSPSDDTPL